MRVLITGGCGFIGTAVSDILLRRGAQILNLDKMTAASNPDRLKEWEGDRYRVMQGDVCDLNLVLNVFEEFQPDQVIHCAAEDSGEPGEGNAQLLQTNFIGTFTLLEAARTWWAGRRGDHRFQLISSDEVYGRSDAVRPFATEGTSFRPETPVAATRAAACHLATAWAETYDLRIVTTVCSNSYGPWQMPEEFVPSAITNAAEGEPVPMRGSAEVVRNWAHVRDHAEAIRLIQEHGTTGETYNIGGHTGQSNANVVRLICGQLDEHLPETAPHARVIEPIHERPAHVERRMMDSAKAWRDLRWCPETDLRQGLSETVRWYLSNRDWWKAARKRNALERMAAA
ncbi:MAG: GDP-mannose 4,6-dehydratase [Pseudomonadota bacterium]